MPGRRLVVLLVATALAVAAVFALVPPIPQDPAYHRLADSRVVLGIPHFGDVVSNAAYFLVGIAGFAALHRHRRAPGGGRAEATLPLAAFFVGFTLIGPASAYYHWNPTTPALFWDRLPMTVAFMALTTTILADRLASRRVAEWGLPLLVAVGVASVISWRSGETAGAGDLRAYALVQFSPVLFMPLVMWLYPRNDALVPGRAVLAAFLLYGLSKAAEALDHEVYALLGGTISGHGLKHVLAAAAAIPFILPLRGDGASGDTS